MKKEDRHISYCGKYYCAFCDYFKGTIVEAAGKLLGFAERYGSLRLIADATHACDFGEFMKGLRWLASQDRSCKGCRFGGGWSWWSDCPIRDCCVRRGVDFCFQCNDFPCKKLREEPLLERKKAMIEANNQMKSMGLKSWKQSLMKKYKRWTTT